MLEPFSIYRLARELFEFQNFLREHQLGLSERQTVKREKGNLIRKIAENIAITEI